MIYFKVLSDEKIDKFAAAQTELGNSNQQFNSPAPPPPAGSPLPHPHPYTPSPFCGQPALEKGVSKSAL